MPARLTTESWIARARAVHGDRFDYSLVEYTRLSERVTIICREHGSFDQFASAHLAGRGCRRCNKRRPITTEEWVSRARKAHGDRYDYSQTEYAGAEVPVVIICPEHGAFRQRPHIHVRRAAGCPQCAIAARTLTTEEWVVRARKAHGDRYDYSLAEYVNRSTPVTIICREHGAFQQAAEKHAAGHGCPRCGNVHKLTTEEWVARARALHGDRYDYSKAVYKGAHEHVTIICPEHGEFDQSARHHAREGGCPRCAPNSKVAKEEWLKRAYEVHGDRYDYSQVEYVNMTETVVIVCREHGPFQQAPIQHTHSGNGCSKCAKRYMPSTEEWIEQAREVHGDKYDYSQVEYVNIGTPVTIICPEHGPFQKTPADHIHQRAGCPVASRERIRRARLVDAEVWLDRYREVHGDTYDYSLVEHVNSKTKITIVCSEHGEFQQTPHDHAQGGYGCPRCSGRYSPTTEEWIEKARAVHGDRYDYSLVEYSTNTVPVTIICPVHGEFQQTPCSHATAGNGCPPCGIARRGMLSRLTHEEWIAKVRELHGDKYDYSEAVYEGAHRMVTIICPTHGAFEQKAHHHTRGHGCTACAASRGEGLVAETLDALGIRYERERRFATCRDQLQLPFDFHLPDYRALIEFDGEQHFRPVRWFDQITEEKAELEFSKIQRRDRIKDEWAEANGYRLLRASDLTTVVDEVVGFIAELERSAATNLKRKAAA